MCVSLKVNCLADFNESRLEHSGSQDVTRGKIKTMNGWQMKSGKDLTREAGAAGWSGALDAEAPPLPSTYKSRRVRHHTQRVRLLVGETANLRCEWEG